MLGKIIDPRGQPTVTAGSDRPSVPTFQTLTKQNNFQVTIVITHGGTMGLAERIIDDTDLMFIYFQTFHK